MKFYITNFYLPKKDLDTFGNNNLSDKTLTEEIDKNVLLITPYIHISSSTDTKYVNKIECVMVPFFVCVKNSASTTKNAKQIASKGLDYLGYKKHYYAFTEEACLTKLNDKFDTSFIQAGRNVIRTFDMKELVTAWENEHFIKDNIISDSVLESNMKAIPKLPNSRSIIEEAKNIMEAAKHKDSSYIPIHYIVEGSERSDFEECKNGFISMLINKGRITSTHVFDINFDVNTPYFHANFNRGSIELSEIISDNMANSLSGNTIVVHYGLNDNEDDYSAQNYYAFCKFIEVIKPYLDNTQLVIAIPSNKSQLQNRIKKLIDLPMSVISINSKPDQNISSFNELMAYLASKAKADKLNPDKKLKDQLTQKLEDKSNWDIDEFYKDWKTTKKISLYYPQYKNQLEDYLKIKNQKEPNSLDRLNEMIGLDEVKQEIKNILCRYKISKYAESKGMPSEKFSLNMIFSGNPGTGKTVVAHLLGQIFKEAGVLSEGRVIVNSGSLGSNELDDLFKNNHGSILFFDEAYDFINSPSITSLISNMERYRDDTVVVLAGYEQHMEALLSCNPGFRSRIGTILKFPDYTNVELFEIFKLMCKHGHKAPTKNALSCVRDIIYRGGKPNDQGNARFIRNIYEASVSNQQVRLAKEMEKNVKINDESLKTLEEQDIPNEFKSTTSAKEQLMDMIGLDEVKATVLKRVNFAATQKLRRDKEIETEFLPMHMAFLGNPGTGKTEVAHLIGKILTEEGILSVGKLINTDPSLFEEPKMVNLAFQQAKGSILFVDEAYTLAKLHPAVLGNFMKNMEDYRKEVVVIFAGYTKEIEALLNANPGFKSRITSLIEFQDYSEEEILLIAEHIAKKHNYKIHNDAISVIKQIIKDNINNRNFGNGRFAKTLIEHAEINQGNRLIQSMENGHKKISKSQLKELTKTDFLNISDIKNEFRQNPIGFCSTNNIAS